LFIFKEQDSNY